MAHQSLAHAPALNEELSAVLSELRREFEKLYGERLVKLVLYGSQARGDARPWSDIDVMVVLKGPVEPGREGSRAEKVLSDLCLRHDVVVLCAYVDEGYFADYQSVFMRNVREEGIAV
jgi:predicted nucleotidyltransferase